MDAYYELFNIVADRIHRDYPGVMVGGPTVLGSHTVFMQEFIERCGDRADFFTIHFYNNDAYLVTKRIKSWNELIQKKTGKSGPLMMITEADDYNLNEASEKQRYLMVRQMELLAIQDNLLGFHQFSLPYYMEAPGRVFGIVREDGRPVDKNYWSYWAFRNLRGSRAAVSVNSADGKPVDDGKTRAQALPVYAVAAMEGNECSAVIYNDGLAGKEAIIKIGLALPKSGSARNIRIDRIHGLERTVVGYSILEQDRQDFSIELDTKPGDTFSIHIIPAGTGKTELMLETDSLGTPSRATIVNGTGGENVGNVVLYNLDGTGRRTGGGTVLARGSRVPGNSILRVELTTISATGTARIIVFEDSAGLAIAESLAF